MKTQNTKHRLNLSKEDVIELNSIGLNKIEGGTISITITNFSRNTLCTSDNQLQ